MFDFKIECRISKKDGSPRFDVTGSCNNRNDAVKLYNLLLHSGYRVSGWNIAQAGIAVGTVLCGCRNETGYAYGMKLRGYSLGAQPRGAVERIDDPTGKYYDIVVYNDPLTTDQIRGYDLEYVGKVQRKWEVVRG